MSLELCVWVTMNSDYIAQANKRESLKHQQMIEVGRLIEKIIIVESGCHG